MSDLNVDRTWWKNWNGQRQNFISAIGSGPDWKSGFQVTTPVSTVMYSDRCDRQSYHHRTAIVAALTLKYDNDFKNHHQRPSKYVNWPLHTRRNYFEVIRTFGKNNNPQIAINYFKVTHFAVHLIPLRVGRVGGSGRRRRPRTNTQS